MRSYLLARATVTAAAVTVALVVSLLTPTAALAAGSVGEAEPNETSAKAQTVALDTQVNATFRTSGDCDNTFYDCDYYKLSTPAAGQLELDVRFSSALGTAGSFNLKVLNASGTVVHNYEVQASDYDGAKLRGLAMFVPAGTFYVAMKTRVSGFGSGYIWSGQPYTLKARVTPGVVETELNGTSAQATPLSLTQTILGTSFTPGDGYTAYDYDYYRVSLATATRLSVDFRFQCSLGTGKTYALSAYDNSGQQLLSKQLVGADCTGAAVRSVPVSAPAGNFYVKIESRNDGIAWGQRYSLSVLKLFFTDVSGTNQFLPEITWMATSGVSTGYEVSGGLREYRPLGSVTRDAMAAFLYRAAGSPAFVPPANSPFSDVAVSNQFYKEITWLASKGVSTGWDVGNGKKEYRPTLPIARDAMAAFLYRNAGSPAYAAPSTSVFRDVPTAYQFYKEISWMSARGISTGYDVYGGKEYRPWNPVARDAMAAFLYRSKN